MFRYLAVAWPEASAQAKEASDALCGAMRSALGWRPALTREGIEVFVTGERPGVNDVRELISGSGLVLGKLFGRGQSAESTHSAATPTPIEQRRILDGGGQALVDDYWGRYVAFLHRPGIGTVVLRDPIGALPCYLLEHGDIRIVFSWLEDVLTLLPGVPVPRIDWSALAVHVVVASISGHQTTLEGVTRVLPGERALLTGLRVERELLWNAGVVASLPNDSTPEQAAREMRDVVLSCVRAWASCYPRLLLRLSGGLDSSILLGCFGKGDESTDVICVNYYSPGSNSDERRYARAAALANGRRLLEHERDASYPLERVLDVARTPSPVSYLGRLGSTRTDARLARSLGIDVMATGGGGDQLFFESRDWSSAADYLHVRGPGAAFFGAAMDSARLSDLSVWRIMRLALRDRLGRRPSGSDDARHLALANREALPDDETCRAFEHPALRVPLPPGKRAHVEQLLFPVDYYDPYELDTAPEHLNPLLSQPAVEFCLATPTYVLASGGYSRALTRRAFAQDLPESILHRHSKGGLEEHLARLLQDNLDFARGLILDGQLVARGLVDRTKVEAVLANRPTTLAAHTTEIHIYLAIEAWLQRIASTPSAAMRTPLATD